MNAAMISILTFFLSSISQAQSVKPGVWAADSSVEMIGIPLPASHDEECVTASEAKDIRKTITAELKKHGCEPTKWKVTGKKAEISLKCAKSGLEASGNLHGTVTEKSYELKGDASGNYKSIPTEATISLKGQWKRDCK